VLERICPTCKFPKVIGLEWAVRKSGKRAGNIRPECRACEKIRMDLYWDNHTEKRSAQRKFWRKKKRNRMRKPLKFDAKLQRKLGNYLRTRINAVLRGRSKSARTKELLGCSIEHLKVWLTFYFQPGMSWSNYGAWHVDHREPCASFDLSDPSQQKECFHYTNLQPLWASENLSKRDKVSTV